MMGPTILAELSFPFELSWWQETVLRSVGVLAAVLLPAGTLVYVFLFKMMSFMQSRLGPMEAGPYGSMQLLAEVGKWIQKEDLIPERADRKLFAYAPYVVILAVFMVYLVVPFGPHMYFANLDIGIFWALGVASISVYGILMASWSSANKYALLGGLRAAGQLIAYELPLILAVVGVVIQAETLNLQGIVAAQHEGEIFGIGWIGNPFVFTQIIGFFIFVVATQAEVAQAPFDMPHAESEVVGGHMVEYSGMRFLLFFIGEFAIIGAFSAIAATLFLGGWAVPWVPLDAWYMNILGPLVLLAKIMFVAFLLFWMRFSMPRFREDQLQELAWKYLIPLSLINIAATMALKAAF
jgi:NADH-quinone oxidoreductase subunit H